MITIYLLIITIQWVITIQSIPATIVCEEAIAAINPGEYYFRFTVYKFRIAAVFSINLETVLCLLFSMNLEILSILVVAIYFNNSDLSPYLLFILIVAIISIDLSAYYLSQ